MKKPTPPIKKRTQDTWVKTALRLPPELHQELLESSEAEIRSMNAEIVVRLSQTPRLTEAIATLTKKQDELHRMMLEVLDRLPGRP